MEDKAQRAKGTESQRKAVSGGYYLKARCIEKSAVYRMPPHVREIWDLFIRKAMWRDGTDLKRGQLLITYKQIQEELAWEIGYCRHTYKKHEIDTAIRALKKATMVTTSKTTRGMIVNVLNYATYQDFQSYETDSDKDTIPTPSRHATGYDREVNNTEKELIEDEDAREAFEILTSEPRLAALSVEQFLDILPVDVDDLSASANTVAREARMNGEPIRHPALFVASRLSASGKKNDVGEFPKKNRAPVLQLLRPSGHVSQRERMAQRFEQLAGGAA